MKNNLHKDIKRKFKDEVFTKLIQEDITKHGKPIHSINSAYIGIEWAMNNIDYINKIWKTKKS